MKKAALVMLVVVIVLVGGYLYITYPRQDSDYLKLQPTQLYPVLCVADNGNAVTYHIPMPKLSGFTKEDANALIEAFALGFCDNL